MGDIVNMKAKKNEPTIEVEVITKETALRYMEKNTDNRNIRESRVRQWCKEITEGRWKLTHQGVAFDINGRLIDGQHRLTALIKTGTALPMVVMRNLPEDVRDSIDQGATRSASDIIGRPHRHVAVIRAIIGLEQNLGPTFKNQVSTSDILERIQRGGPDLEAIDAIIKMTVPKGAKGYFVAGTYAALAYCYPIASKLVLTFAEQLAFAENVTRLHPIWRLREWLVNNKRTTGLDQWQAMMAVLGAFCHAAANTDQTRFYVGPAGYKAITSKRRSANIPDTPSAKDIAHYNGFKMDLT